MATCPACGKLATTGATQCGFCGKPIPPSVDTGDIDLLPEEAPKASAFQAYEQPAELAPGELPTSGRKKKRDRTKEAIPLPAAPVLPEDPTIKKDNLKFAMIAGGVLLVLVLLVCLKVCRVESKITGRAPFEQTFAILPEKPRVENYDIVGDYKYSFDVQPLDGDVLVGVAQRAPTDPATPQALKALPEGLTPIKKGETEPMTGEFHTGKYSWIIIAEGKKAVRVKVKFSAK